MLAFTSMRKNMAGLTPNVVRLILSALLVGAAALVVYHFVVLSALRSSAAQMPDKTAVMEGPAVELAVEQVTETPRSDPGPVPQSGENPSLNPDAAPKIAGSESALDEIDWRMQVNRALATAGLWATNALIQWIVLTVLVLVLFSVWKRFPGVMNSVPVMVLGAILVAVGFFSLLNNIVAPERAHHILGVQSKRFSFRNHFQQATGSLVPASSDAANDSSTFRKAADHYRAVHKSVKETLDALDPRPSAKRPDHLRLWELLSRDDADMLQALEKKLAVRSRILARPGNTWLGFHEPDHLRFTPREHGFAGASLITPEAVRGRLVALVSGDTEKAGGKNKGAGGPALKLLCTLLSADMERLQGDLGIVIIRRANGPFQFAIMSVLALGILIFIQRWLDALRQRDNVATALPRIPHVDSHSGKECPTGGPIDWVTVDLELSRSQAASKRRDNLGARLVHTACRAFQDTRRAAAADEALRKEAQGALEQSASERHTLGYIAWMIPCIGITATAFSIGNALLQAGKLLDAAGDAGEALQKFFAELGVTFDVTLFALMGSILMMWLFQRLQRSEEYTIYRAEEQVRDLVVEKLIETNRTLKLEYQTAGGIATIKAELLKFERATDAKPSPEGSALIVRVLGNSSGSAPAGTMLVIPMTDLTDVCYKKFIDNYFDGSANTATRVAWLNLR